MKIIMTGDTYFIGFISKGDMALVERQPRMAVVAINLFAFFMHGICAVNGD